MGSLVCMSLGPLSQYPGTMYLLYPLPLSEDLSVKLLYLTMVVFGNNLWYRSQQPKIAVDFLIFKATGKMLRLPKHKSVSL